MLWLCVLSLSMVYMWNFWKHWKCYLCTKLLCVLKAFVYEMDNFMIRFYSWNGKLLVVKFEVVDVKIFWILIFLEYPLDNKHYIIWIIIHLLSVLSYGVNNTLYCDIVMNFKFQSLTVYWHKKQLFYCVLYETFYFLFNCMLNYPVEFTILANDTLIGREIYELKKNHQTLLLTIRSHQRITTHVFHNFLIPAVLVTAGHIFENPTFLAWRHIFCNFTLKVIKLIVHIQIFRSPPLPRFVDPRRHLNLGRNLWLDSKVNFLTLFYKISIHIVDTKLSQLRNIMSNRRCSRSILSFLSECILWWFQYRKRVVDSFPVISMM